MFDLEEEYESDLDLDINLSYNQQTEEEELQRTPQWRLDRMGCLTGSKGKTIAACNRKGSKMSWMQPEKVFEFSEGIVSYIYACAMERKTGNYIEGSSNMAMRYGTIIEPLIKRRILEEYLNELEYTLEEVGFKKFDDIPTAGVSSDSLVRDAKGKLIATAEFKACVTWETHYKRTYEKTDESSIDFWQMIMQMIAWKINKAYYFVVTPPKDIMLYIREENPMDLYDEWCKETQLSMEIINISEIHTNALKHRIRIIESVITRFIALGTPIKDLLEEEIKKEKQKYLETVTEFEEEIIQEEPQQEETVQELNFDDSPF